jgi:hypothetical protein
MAELITPEMLDAFVVQATYDKLPDALAQRCAGLADRVSLRARQTVDPDAWRSLVADVRAAVDRVATQT